MPVSRSSSFAFKWGSAAGRPSLSDRPGFGLLPSVRLADNDARPCNNPAPETGDSARTTAGTLMDFEAILFRPEDPFIFTSGRASPVYVDFRKIIFFPAARIRLMALAVEPVETETGAAAFDVGAGGETAHTFVVFHYGIFPQSIAALAEHGVTLHALATWWDALALAEERGYLEDPEAWSAAHGGETRAEIAASG